MAQKLLRHAPGSRVTMERYAHVTAAQQRDAAMMLEVAVTGSSQSVTQSVTGARNAAVRSRTELPIEGILIGELAPAVGLEPTTKRLTAARSTD